MNKEQTENFFDNLKRKKVEKLIEAGFTEKQANLLVEMMEYSQFGFL